MGHMVRVGAVLLAGSRSRTPGRASPTGGHVALFIPMCRKESDYNAGSPSLSKNARLRSFAATTNLSNEITST